MSDDDNIDVDGDDADIRDIFDDPVVEEQLRQNDIQCEWELQEQGETFTVDIMSPQPSEEKMVRHTHSTRLGPSFLTSQLHTLHTQYVIL